MPLHLPITRRQVLGVPPFGNLVATVEVSCEELMAMIENGISRMSSADGRFPQVSGLCFDFNIEVAAGSRVSNVRYANPDGTCSATPVDLGADPYLIAENDFMASGSDGYPKFFSRATTQDIMDQMLADYVAGNSPISPIIQGRIKCVDPNPSTGNNCPAGSL